MSNHPSNKSTAGYEGSKPVQGVIDPEQVWTLRKPEYFYSERIVAQIFRGEEAKGILYLDSEEEFEWIKLRIERTL